MPDESQATGANPRRGDRRTAAAGVSAVGRDPTWYRDAVIYQTHVRAFYDSDGDGIGDFRGLASKLDYVEDLGVTAIWLLPFYPSPLRDEGYDIADYEGVNASYGSLRDFKHFLREAHRRGLRVITELVINHTSDQHPWFQRARRAAPGSRHRNYYVWSDSTERYRDARVIFQDFEASNWEWDALAGAYYWHRFYKHQPDLNFESPDVRKAVRRFLDHWLGLGVDGLRLDAVPYLFEEEGTNCENLPATHEFLKELRAHVDRRYEDRMLLAEANQWPEDAAEYFGDGDECHMNFHFPLMPRLFMSTRMEDRYPIIDILQQTPEIDETCQWAIFLRNHDELTLEMVTDEERDYMYRVYARDRQARVNLGIRRRLAPLMDNNRSKIELMNGLLLSLPGTPIIYYGDEIGMGDNFYLGDRNAVRTPMQWSNDRNAGFSRANPQSLYLPPIIDPQYHFETVNVEAQLANPESLLWWMKRLLTLRSRYPVLGRGAIEFLYPENHRVLAFIRRDDTTQLLVVANLARHPQYVELDLSEFKGMVPLELSGHTAFPPIGELPYLLTLSSYQFMWFELTTARAELTGVVAPFEAPAMHVTGAWDSVLASSNRRTNRFKSVLPGFLASRRWFGGKARKIQRAVIVDVVPLPRAGRSSSTNLALVEVEYVEGEPEMYALPLSIAARDYAELIAADVPHAIVSRLERDGEHAFLIDGFYDPGTADMLADVIRRRRKRSSKRGEIAGRPTAAMPQFGSEGFPAASLARVEQSNTSAVFGDHAVLKLFRRLAPGVNPDLEIGRFLTERTDFEHAPAVLGALEYRSGRDEPVTVGVLHQYVPNEGDVWRYTLDHVARTYESLLGQPDRLAELGDALGPASTFELAGRPLPPEVAELLGAYVDSAELLGQRTAELHMALASDREDPDFAPEPVSRLYQRSLYQSMRNLTRTTLQTLRRARRWLTGDDAVAAESILGDESALLDRFRPLLGGRITASRIRCHGDLHLGQVLFTGRDFVIIDFEGEPARPISERRLKRPALRDVAGMLRSFDYAAHVALRDLEQRGAVISDTDAYRQLAACGRVWERAVGSRFLAAYLLTAADQPFLPDTSSAFGLMLDVFVLEKAIYELGYELNNRPDYTGIPMAPILEATS